MSQIFTAYEYRAPSILRPEYLLTLVQVLVLGTVDCNMKRLAETGRRGREFYCVLGGAVDIFQICSQVIAATLSATVWLPDQLVHNVIDPDFFKDVVFLFINVKRRRRGGLALAA